MLTLVPFSLSITVGNSVSHGPGPEVRVGIGLVHKVEVRLGSFRVGSDFKHEAAKVPESSEEGCRLWGHCHDKHNIFYV